MAESNLGSSCKACAGRHRPHTCSKARWAAEPATQLNSPPANPPPRKPPEPPGWLSASKGIPISSPRAPPTDRTAAREAQLAGRAIPRPPPPESAPMPIPPPRSSESPLVALLVPPLDASPQLAARPESSDREEGSISLSDDEERHHSPATRRVQPVVEQAVARLVRKLCLACAGKHRPHTCGKARPPTMPRKKKSIGKRPPPPPPMDNAVAATGSLPSPQPSPRRPPTDRSAAREAQEANEAAERARSARRQAEQAALNVLELQGRAEQAALLNGAALLLSGLCARSHCEDHSEGPTPRRSSVGESPHHDSPPPYLWRMPEPV
jgi:hypothetical protein